MSKVTAHRDLEGRVEALRRELAAVIVTLCNLGQRLEDVADELRPRPQADNVVALKQRSRAKARDESDILVSFLS